MREVRSLTAIRGVAALWVVSAHLAVFYRFPHLGPISKRMYLGFTGVDIFFVLSGFILMRVYQNLRFSGLADFALRRVLRIYPMHLCVLAVMAPLVYFSIVWRNEISLWHTLPIVALLIQPYIGLTHGFWNPPSWSAAVELSCYMLFYPALVLLRRLPLALLAPLVLLAAFLDWHIQSIYDNAWFDWRCIVRGWSDFALGMVLGGVAIRLILPQRMAMLGEIVATALLGWACIQYDIQLVVLSGAGLIWMLSYEAGLISRLLGMRVPFFLGKISFSIYLIHFPFLEAYGVIWWTSWDPPLSLLFVVREIVFITALIGMASVTHYLIERPAQRLWRNRKRNAANPPVSGQYAMAD